MSDSDPGDGLGEAFWAVARRLRTASMAALAEHDVTPSQVRAIRVLSAHDDGGVRSSELAHHLKIAPRSTTEVVDALEAKGLVTRTRDTEDRRAVLVALSERGRRLAEEIRRTRGEQSDRVFERLSHADREHLARILGTLQDG